MRSKQKNQPLEVTDKRHRQLVVAFAVVSVGVVLLYGLAQIPSPDVFHRTSPQGGVGTDSAASTAQDAYALATADPVRLRIPTLNIDASFEGPLGLNADQTIEVPDSFESVGWYQYGPTPGELGPAVVLGHVDSYRGPAVFYTLGQLKSGDQIEIDRADGSTAVFEVTALERHEQADFPTVAVYGDIDHAGLRLITCSGVYDRGSLRYSHNLIVFARLVASE